MTNVSHSCGHGLDIEFTNPLHNLLKTLKGFFEKNETTHAARLYHGKFSYGLVPDTAISSVSSMIRATSLDSGDCYIYIFENPHYQGRHRIVGPGERVDIGNCGSLITSEHPISIAAAQKSGRAPEQCWELDGPMYLMHFYATYRYS